MVQIDGTAVRDFLTDAGIIGLLGTAVWGVLRGWWVPAHYYERTIADLRKAEADVDAFLEHAHKVTDLTERIAEQVEVIVEWVRRHP